MLVWLTPELVRRLARKLCARDRREILLMYESIDLWARDRCELPGSAWAMMRGTEILGAGGIHSISEETGVVWIAGTKHWTDYAMHVIRAWRAILALRVYKHFEANCHIGNRAAQRFIEWAGFERVSEYGCWIHYRMTP